MKQCPECHEHYEDEQNFCDSDGTPLVDETALLRSALGTVEPHVPVQPQSRQIWPIVTIGILIGVIISLSAYVLMVMPNAEKDSGKNNRAESARFNPSDMPGQATTLKS